MNTAIGNIARVGHTMQRDVSPLQQEVNVLPKTLTKLAGVIALTLFLLNVLQGAFEIRKLASGVVLRVPPGHEHGSQV